MARPKPDTKKEFLKRVSIGDDCWQWMGAGSQSGYGNLHTVDGNRYAHRISYEIFKGPITDGLYVLHSCDNRMCVNPKHLSLGTHADNQLDKLRRGRTPRNEAHWNCKIPKERIPEVFAMRKSGMSQTAIGKVFGVGQDQISRIVNRKRRKYAHEEVATP